MNSARKPPRHRKRRNLKKETQLEGEEQSGGSGTEDEEILKVGKKLARKSKIIFHGTGDNSDRDENDIDS